MPFAYDHVYSVLRFRPFRGFMTTMLSARTPPRLGAFTPAASTFFVILMATPSLARAQDLSDTPDPASASDESDLAGPGDYDLVDGSEAAPDAPAESSAVLEDSDYGVDLRSLEEQVNDLKEKVFKSKARLVLLRETVLNGVISGARAVLTHRNEMGPSLTLERVSYSLDGEPLLNRADEDGSLDGQTEIPLFEGSIVPGTHNLSVLLVYRGNGFGIFTYLRDYVFKIRASFPFTAEEGKLVSVKAVAYETGGITTDLTDRPTIRFETEVKKDVRAGGLVEEAETAP